MDCLLVSYFSVSKLISFMGEHEKIWLFCMCVQRFLVAGSVVKKINVSHSYKGLKWP